MDNVTITEINGDDVDFDPLFAQRPEHAQMGPAARAAAADIDTIHGDAMMAGDFLPQFLGFHIMISMNFTGCCLHGGNRLWRWPVGTFVERKFGNGVAVQQLAQFHRSPVRPPRLIGLDGGDNRAGLCFFVRHLATLLPIH